MNMETLNTIAAIVGYIGIACGLAAKLCPPGKLQHWLAWAGNAASKKPLPSEESK